MQKFIGGGLLLLMLTGAGCTTTMDGSVSSTTSAKPAAKISAESVKPRCESSGGIFSNDACVCPSSLTYDSGWAYCLDATGNPGGKLGVEMKAEGKDLNKNPKPY